MVSCGDAAAPAANAPDTTDSGTSQRPTGELCARPAEGCSCAPGEAPVRCMADDNAETGLCRIGEMTCRRGFWSACESLHSIGSVGGSTQGLISPLTECSSCNPGCITARDEPNDMDLNPGNSDPEIEYDPDEGGITLDTRRPPVVPSCAELAGGGIPGGSYAQFCMGDGSLILLAPGAMGMPAPEVCADELAADTFQNALCSCDDIDGAYNLTTDSFNSNGTASTGLAAHVRTNGSYLLGGTADIGGELTGYSSVFHSPGANHVVELGVFMNGRFTTSSRMLFGQTMGDFFVNGDVMLSQTDVQGGAGTLHLPMGAMLNTTHPTQTYMVVREPVVIEPPCACSPTEIIDIAGFVSAFSGMTNDNSVIGLDPDDFNGVAGPAHVVLPCGRFYMNDIDVSNSAQITATGRTALFVNGDIRSGASLSIDLGTPDAEVDVFVSGTIDAGASFTLGDSARPGDVRLYVAGSDPINFSGHGVFGGNFYAPNADVDTGGSIHVHGSLFVGHLTAGSAVRITYDEAVQEVDCNEPTGRYWRNYDASSLCGFDDEVRPDWGAFQWDVDVPDGQLITFEIRTAATLADLDTVDPISFDVPPNASPIDIGDLLVAGGDTNFQPFLRVTAVLQSDGSNAPLLRSFDLQFDCSYATEGTTNPGAWTCGGMPVQCVQNCVPEICGDGLDNDCDGMADCADSDCARDAACCLGEICGDFQNNDCDDLEDFYDPECVCVAELCGDGLDNDADGLTDCADTDDCVPGDSCNPYGSECDMAGACVCPTGTMEICTDGLDNDCNGRVDCDQAACNGICNCGDLVLNPEFGETCDDGGETAACNANCTIASCGDGTMNMTAGEQCDDGNIVDADSCSNGCLSAPDIILTGFHVIDTHAGTLDGGPLRWDGTTIWAGDFIVQPTAVVQVIGGQPLSVVASGAVVVDGTIDVSGADGGSNLSGCNDPGGEGGAAGAGGFDGGNGGDNIGTTPTDGAGPGGGSAGGTVNGSAGGGGGGGHELAGAAGGSGTGGTGGPAYASLPPLVGGSGGGGGGAEDDGGGGFDDGGGGGGGGGGVVRIVSQTTITVSGTIDASGGNGGQGLCGGGGGGGGSGGAIQLLAASGPPTITGATLDVTGGAAGASNGGAASRGRLDVGSVSGCLVDADCNDGQFCNGTETCDAMGVCQPGTAVICDDGVSCTIDSCSESSDTCFHTADDTVCDDGLYCNGTETCDGVLDCQAGLDPCGGAGCDDTLDACGCVSDPDCDDAVFCNGVELCSGGFCAPGTPVACDDGVACTTNVCDTVADSCANPPDDTRCNDGNFCTVDYCDAVADCSTVPALCDDGNACTTDSCDPMTGCLATPIPGCCGNGTCEAASAENVCTCTADCGAPTAAEALCGDGLDDDCDGMIDCADPDCAADPLCVPYVCGNGICEGSGEDCFTCVADCLCGGGAGCPTSCCGNGIREPGENAANCPIDP